LPVLECPPVLLGITLFGRTLSIRPLKWHDLAESRLRLDRLSRNAAGRLSSPGLSTPRGKPRGDPGSPIPRETRNSPGWHPSLRYGLHAGAAPIASGLLIAIEAAMVAGSKTANKENYHG